MLTPLVFFVLHSKKYKLLLVVCSTPMTQPSYIGTLDGGRPNIVRFKLLSA
ncbi:hypothetical protein VCHA40O237_40254 [Vibrio chagasii]|nr:hypothetical protein VCHA40O237_40254 [Vibrio chagasii]CAH7309349.1 hypothetical protein VCHA48P437_40254 [Vibrio chagasii]CAH7334877.1 hypothetical protein VCHA44O286_40253 [Vibrio chagasii]CAH7463987.1 hypothetical protein VCHA55O508_50043 [Vibrio chagasii]